MPIPVLFRSSFAFSSSSLRITHYFTHSVHAPFSLPLIKSTLEVWERYKPPPPPLGLGEAAPLVMFRARFAYILTHTRSVDDLQLASVIRRRARGE